MQAAKGNGNQRDEPGIESRGSRKELLETIRPGYWKHLREDCGDLPDGWPGPRSASGRTRAVSMNNSHR